MLEPHDQFRLWLTTESSDQFPVILLQQSLKITFESPPGIKNNLIATYDMWDDKILSQNNSLIRAQLMFVLAWFHAVVQERRSYIPQGWSTFYEFSTADLRSAVDIIDTVCLGKEEPDWQTIYGLLGEAIYGGRLDNRYDRRVLQAYLKKFFTPSMVSTVASRSGPRLNLFRDIAIPTSMSHADHLKMIINKVDDFNTPDLFGLSANADKLVMASRSAQVMENLKMLTLHGFLATEESTSNPRGADSPATMETESSNKEKWSAHLKSILQYWKKITGDYAQILFSVSQTTGGRDKLSTKEDISPIEAFVTLEFRNAISLVNHIDTSFADVNNVVRGTTLLTPFIQVISDDLISGRVPQKWQSMWEGPPQIQTWLAQVVHKTVALHDWRQRVENGTLLNDVLHLKDLFHPDIFLNALRQQTARVTKQPLDDLTELAAWWNPPTSSRKDKNRSVLAVQKSPIKIRVKGLMIQGCGFDGESITDLSPDAPTLSEVPMCELAWVSPKHLGKKDHSSCDQDQSMIGVPIYFATDRQRLLVELDIPCSSEPSKYILTGLAMFVDTYE